LKKQRNSHQQYQGPNNPQHGNSGKGNDGKHNK
jgi:hypothetical protein